MACENCYSGYTWTDYDLPGDPRCYRVISTNWVTPETTVPLINVSDVNYSTQNGRLITDYDISGFSTSSFYTLTSTTLWVNSALTTSDGALNRTGVWADLSCDTGDYLPKNQWVGFSVCVGDASSAKTYYVGIAANDNFKIELDGIPVVNTLLAYPTGNTTTSTVWRIYELQVPKGDNHTLEIFGLNLGGTAAIGAELYDTTLSNILTASTLGELNIIWNTRDESFVRSFQTRDGHYVGDSGYTCCDGFVVSTCSGSCLQYIVCGPEITQSPIPSQTPTPTPSVTPTPLIYSNFVSGCCDNIIYQLLSGNKYIVGTVLRVSPINFCYQVIPDVKYNTFDILNDKLGVTYTTGCSDIKCQPCQTSDSSGSTCDIITIPDMILECVTTDPSYFGVFDGSVGLNISGGTPPYTTVWQTPYGISVTAQTINNAGDGAYTATTTDFWGDFVQSIVCTLEGPKECEFEADVVPFPCISPTPKATPTMTPTMKPTGTPQGTPLPTPTPSPSFDPSLPPFTPVNAKCHTVTLVNNPNPFGCAITYTGKTGTLQTVTATATTMYVCAVEGTVSGNCNQNLTIGAKCSNNSDCSSKDNTGANWVIQNETDDCRIWGSWTTNAIQYGVLDTCDFPVNAGTCYGTRAIPFVGNTVWVDWTCGVLGVGSARITLLCNNVVLASQFVYTTPISFSNITCSLNQTFTIIISD